MLIALGLAQGPRGGQAEKRGGQFRRICLASFAPEWSRLDTNGVQFSTFLEGICFVVF